MIGSEQRDFHSTLSSMKVTHTQTHTVAKIQNLPSCLASQTLASSFFFFSSLLFPVFSLSYFFHHHSLSLSFSAIPPSSYPRLLGCWVLFPGSSSCPEGGVMGKALLSLLGLSQILFLSSSLHLFSLPSPRLAHTSLSLIPPSELAFSRSLFLLPFFHLFNFLVNLQAFIHVMIIKTHTMKTQTGNGPSNLRSGS